MKDLLNYKLYIISRLSIFKFCCSKAACEEEHSLEIEFPVPATRQRCEGSFHFSTEILYEKSSHKKKPSFDSLLDPIME